MNTATRRKPPAPSIFTTYQGVEIAWTVERDGRDYYVEYHSGGEGLTNAEIEKAAEITAEEYGQDDGSIW